MTVPLDLDQCRRRAGVLDCGRSLPSVVVAASNGLD
jgi:hypothetical protein